MWRHSRQYITAAYQAELWELKRSMFNPPVIVQMEGQYQPEDSTGTPDKNSLSEAGWELGLISVPCEVTVPKGDIPAQARKIRGIILLHIPGTVHYISKNYVFLFASFSAALS
jgi:hypothetical protein